MATKDWQETEIDDDFVRYEKLMSEAKWNVLKNSTKPVGLLIKDDINGISVVVYGRKVSGHFQDSGEIIDRDFKTKAKANAYAKRYMRSH